MNGERRERGAHVHYWPAHARSWTAVAQPDINQDTIDTPDISSIGPGEMEHSDPRCRMYAPLPTAPAFVLAGPATSFFIFHSAFCILQSLDFISSKFGPRYVLYISVCQMNC